MSTDKTLLTRLKIRYVRIRTIETLLLSIAVALALFIVLFFFNTKELYQVAIPLFSALISFAIRYFQLGLHATSEKSVASYLNKHYPELSGSADLMLASEDTLSGLANIQRARTRKSLEVLPIQFPNRIKTFFGLCILAMAFVWIVNWQDIRIQSLTPSDHLPEIQSEKKTPAHLPAAIKDVTMNVTPPAYTGLRNYDADDFNLSVPENSRVTWTLNFSHPVKRAGMLLSAGDTIWFTRSDTVWRLQTTLDRTGFYHVVWKDESTHATPYYKIEVRKDQPPAIDLPHLNQFTQVTAGSKEPIQANPVITDDYGLSDAYIIATVSKGSGESVKFREEKIKFPGTVSGKHIQVRQSIDLTRLGMEPGDELYFYIEAIDTKTPVPNRTRTETYFVIIPDTAQDVQVADGGLGVDLMPEYFRSQRQIIIDSEKLIREKKTTPRKEFNSRSNELGYDQKVLRLRYGQFLGEEDESAGQPEAHDHEGEHEEEKPEDIIKAFGHQHDTENEHNLVDEKNPAQKDIDGSKKTDIPAEFLHQHDNEESATFFFQSIKIKLKAALAQMWEAELYLRLYEPEKSLPYQYTALKLLKEISNDSRIYVHRTGFEPPPIKEEKRLSADLSEIHPATHAYRHENETRFPKITEAFSLTEKLLAGSIKKLSPQEKNILSQSGVELAQVALENPALLEGLHALRAVTDSEKEINPENLRALRKAYWRALPEKPAPAGKRKSMLHELDDLLLKQLEASAQ